MAIKLITNRRRKREEVRIGITVCQSSAFILILFKINQNQIMNM